MAFSPQEKEMLLQGALSNYIFNFAFESRNPGYTFDVDSWGKALDNFGSSNDLNIMTPAKQRELQGILGDLDRFKIPKPVLNPTNEKPKLKLV